MKALVIGGTGPSGPHIVNGLISRGYDVSVLHGGQHEIRFDEEIEHIHVDPHFQETALLCQNMSEPFFCDIFVDYRVNTYVRSLWICWALSKLHCSRLKSR